MVNVSAQLIDRMAREIVREVAPSKSSSSVPGLVVPRKLSRTSIYWLSNENRSARTEVARIWRCLTEFRVPTDILVYSVDELAQWRDSAHHVVAQALREGRVLYESS